MASNIDATAQIAGKRGDGSDAGFSKANSRKPMSGKVEYQECLTRGTFATGHTGRWNSGDEVRTTVRLQYFKRTLDPPHRYPIPLQLRYKATTKHGPLYGFGQTRMMSSKEIIFGGGNGLKPGMKAEIAVAWPLLLNGRIRLQLVLHAIITASQDGVTEARILAYQFRTRGPAEAEQRTEPVSIGDVNTDRCTASARPE